MYKLLIALLLFLVGMHVAQAALYGAPTETEKAMLPAYCGGPGGEGVDWRKRLGEARIWNNHTCYGINSINRYYRAKSTEDRRFHLNTARQDLNYSVEHLPEDFLLMPEVYYYRGMVYKLLGNNSQAVSDWLKSISLDKHYVNSIVDLADLIGRDMKNPEKALTLVTQGLRDNPDSKGLKRRYKLFGGKEPFPEPYKPKVETPPPAEDTKPKEPEQAAAAVPEPVPAPEVETVISPASPNAPIGSPTNPWCRFCPDPPAAADPGTSKPTTGPTDAP